MERRVHDQRRDEHRGGDHGVHAAQTDARATAVVRVASVASVDCAMRIAVVGAGAIGGFLGGWLSAAGEEVTFIARGANLDAIAKNGMRVIGEDGVESVTKGARAVRTAREAGPQDAVLLTV